MSDHHDGHDTGGHAVPHKMLIGTCAALLLLTGITVWSSKIDFNELQMPEMNIIIAIGIATFKVALVGLIFMHLRWDRSFTAFIFVSSILLVGLFISFAMMDSKEYQPEVIQTNSVEIQQKLDALPKAPPAKP
jgi:cytochrome c oxidase subunit 4